jgi:hypothetical protein
MRFDQLTPADFPGLDPQRFEEWKSLRASAMRSQTIAAVIFIGGLIVGMSLVGGAIGSLIPMAIGLAYWGFVTIPGLIRFGKMTKALGLRDQLNAKLREPR